MLESLSAGIETERYSRQMIIPEIGAGGQARLQRSRVLIGGVGGLGSILAYQMAAAGVGAIRLVDRDRVELSNLNRQLIHGTPDLGRSKVQSAREKLERLNPACCVEPIQAEICRETVESLARGCQIILDGTDNLAARQVLNHAAFRLGLPFVYGGVDGFTGMVATFVPGRGPCFACLFPGQAPSGGRIIGVLGAVPGVIGSLQSIEGLKLLLGLEQTLAGKLLVFNGLNMTFRAIEIAPNPECDVCRAPGGLNLEG